MSAVGCAPAPDRASHTVEEYRRDAKLRELTFARFAKELVFATLCLTASMRARPSDWKGWGRSQVTPLELSNPPHTDLPSKT